MKIDPDLLSLATPEERAEVRRFLDKEDALRSPLSLACYLDPSVQRFEHAVYLDDRIVALVELRLYKSGPGPEANWFYRLEQDDKVYPALDHYHIPSSGVEEFWGEHPEIGERVLFRLGIAMPPRHGKSFIVTEHLPLWYWLKYPNNDMALATYADWFAEEWGAKIRDRICQDNEDAERENKKPKIGLALKKGRKARAGYLQLDNSIGSGTFALVGVGGGLTGRGYQLGIIDDPFKDHEDARSEATREARSKWYTTVFIKRKTRVPGRLIPVEIMMFTRWDPDDIAGRHCYDEEGNERKDWYVLRLPALAEAEDPLGRPEGAALCSALKTRAELLSEQKDDPEGFASLNQGDPQVSGNDNFKNWRTYGIVRTNNRTGYMSQGEIVWEDECYRFATMDLATSLKETADFTVYTVWDYHREQKILVVVGMVRERVSSDRHEDHLRECYKLFPHTGWVGIEEATYGLALIQRIARRGDVPTRPLKAKGDKVQRAEFYGKLVYAGRVWLRADAPYRHTWELEHRQFPRGKHDDIVDTGAYAALEIDKLPPPRNPLKDPVTMQEKVDAMLHKRQQKQSKRAGIGRLF